MPKTKISEFSATPGNNTDIDGINIAEGCAPSGINDAIRELMAQLKDFQAGTAGDSFNGPVGTSTAAAGAFTTLTTSSTVTHNGGTANGVAYLNGSKVLTTGSALSFDGTQMGLNIGPTSNVTLDIKQPTAGQDLILGLSAGTGARAQIRSVSQADATSSVLAFHVTSGSSTAEQMRLTSTGLGIGTSSPQRKLHVNATPGATYGDVARFESNGSAGPVTLSFGDSGTSSALPTIGGNGNSLVFGTGAATQMTLNLSGNLGLGVTPSAWNSDYRTMQFGATGLLYGRSGGEVAFGTNWYRDSGGTFRYLTTAAATYQAQASGIHYWFTAPSGTAGNAISFTQAMTLDSDGNLALGRSSVTTLGTNIRTIDLDGIQGSGFRFRANGTSYAYIFGGSVQTDLATLTSTPLIFSTNATERARITSNGNLVVGQTGGDYRILSVVPSGADRDMFLAGVSGVTNGLQVNYINSGAALSVKFNDITTTASAANAFLDSANANRIYRSTSSIRYKKDIEDIDHEFADAALNLRPVWYRSKTDSDNKDWSWYGLIAEEVAEVEPRLVHWTYPEEAFDVETVDGVIKKTVKDGAERIPDGVQYERLSVLLLDIVKRQNARIESLEAKVAALESNP